jgi:hypothetical protein
MKLSISLQFKIEKYCWWSTYADLRIDVWVTIDINPCKFDICWWQAFQFGSRSIKMYTKCTTVQNGGLFVSMTSLKNGSLSAASGTKNCTAQSFVIHLIDGWWQCNKCLS